MQTATLPLAMYPMVSMGDRQQNNLWQEMAFDIDSTKFKHFLRANKKDDMYIKFLKGQAAGRQGIHRNQDTEDSGDGIHILIR